MSRIVDVEPLDCLAWKDGEHGTTFDDGVLWVLEKIGELPAIQTCEDAVSRQAAIDALAKFVPYAICDASTESYTNGLTDAYNLICQLPSVQPERLKGRWTDNNACPFCGFQPWYERDIHTLSYCPNCGADMRKENR